VIMVTDPSHALSPGINTALMIGQMLLILLYAYRFKQQELPDFKISEENTLKNNHDMVIFQG